MGKPTPRIPCHLWEPFSHVGHAYRRGDQTVHCPGRNRPGMPWISPKPSRAARRARVMTEWHNAWDAGRSPDLWETMSGGCEAPAVEGEA